MKKLILTYGAIAGTIVIATMCIGLLVMPAGAFPQWLGFLIMLVGLSLIFMGIKRYRDDEQGGIITFGKATLVGLGIAATAGVMYVVGWELYLATTDYAFIEEYTAAQIENRRQGGATEAEMAEFISAMDSMKEDYANPAYRLPITFIEIFPMALLVTLVSAGILRRSEVLPASD